MTDVVVFGVGEFGRLAAVYLEEDSPHDVVAFAVHEKYIRDPELLGKPVVPLERLEETHPPDRHAMFVAIGYSRVNEARREVYEECKERGYELISYVSSRATVWSRLELGDNCFIFENNVIQPFVGIGSDVIIWSGSHVGHDSTIGDHCFIAPHAAIPGGVTIGHGCFIGTNATIRNGVIVAPQCVIGAGALIMNDTVAGEVYPGLRTNPREDSSSGINL